jgi:hypothetical protein
MCKKCFAYAWSIGHQAIDDLLAEAIKPTIPCNSKGPRKTRADKGSGLAADVFPHMLEFCEDYGEHLPHITVSKVIVSSADGTNRVVWRVMICLPSGLYNSKLECIKEMKLFGKIPEGAKDDTIYKIWREHLWHVKVKTWQPFSKCDTCAEFKAAHILRVMEIRKRNGVATEETPEFKKCKELRAAHLARVMLTRSRYMLRYSLTRAFPDIFLHVVIDGMDNKKTNLPHCNSEALKSKNLDNSGEVLQTKLMGTLVEGRGFINYMTMPTMYHGANTTWTVFLHVLHELKQVQGELPPVLLLQLDNCGRDNKNMLTFVFFSWLAFLGVFEEVQLNFLPVGHTHCEIDQRFSVISKAIKAKDLLTPDDMFNILRDLCKNKKRNGGDHDFNDDAEAQHYIRKDAVLEQVNFKNKLQNRNIRRALARASNPKSVYARRAHLLLLFSTMYTQVEHRTDV